MQTGFIEITLIYNTLPGFVSTTRLRRQSVKRKTLAQSVKRRWDNEFSWYRHWQEQPLASLINSDGNSVFRAFSFSNTTGGGEALVVGGWVFLVMYMIGKEKGKIE